jgi:methylase of polypeptide subunit release factors
MTAAPAQTIKEKIMQPTAGESLTAMINESDTYIAKMQNGVHYTISQENWSLRHDYYLDMFVEHLPLVVQELQQGGNPLRHILEMGIARGVLSIGLALLTTDATQIVGIDIDPEAAALVAQNAATNGVADRIEVRIGDLFAPVKADERFDVIIGELPMNVVDPQRHQEYVEAGYGAELLNIGGGADGRYFIDALITQGAHYLNPGGAIVFIQSSFVSIEKSMQRFAEVGLTGSIVAQREWLLKNTKFTRMNRPFIEAVHGNVFDQRADGEDIFYLTIMKGVKAA